MLLFIGMHRNRPGDRPGWKNRKPWTGLSLVTISVMNGKPHWKTKNTAGSRSRFMRLIKAVAVRYLTAAPSSLLRCCCQHHCFLQLHQCKRQTFHQKAGSVKAKEFYVNVKVRENDKDVTRSAKAGFIFRNGETISSNIIVLVPKWGNVPKYSVWSIILQSCDYRAAIMLISRSHFGQSFYSDRFPGGNSPVKYLL